MRVEERDIEIINNANNLWDTYASISFKKNEKRL
jgi:hypothetical protein